MSGIFLPTDIPISRLHLHTLSAPIPFVHCSPSPSAFPFPSSGLLPPFRHALSGLSPLSTSTLPSIGSQSFPGVPSPSGFRPPCPSPDSLGIPSARGTPIPLAIPFASCKNARVFTKWNSHFFDVSGSPKFGLQHNLSARRRNTI